MQSINLLRTGMQNLFFTKFALKRYAGLKAEHMDTGFAYFLYFVLYAITMALIQISPLLSMVSIFAQRFSRVAANLSHFMRQMNSSEPCKVCYSR